MSFSDLPSLSNLIQHPVWKSEPILKHETENKEKSSTDPRLKNWHEWMKKRKKMHIRLGHLIKRDPGNLLMNNAEEIRQIKEQKAVFEYSRLVQDQDCEVPSIESIGVPEGIMLEKDVMPRKRNQFTTWKESACYKKKCEEYQVALSIIQPHKPDLNMLQIRGCRFLQTKDQTQELPHEEKDESLQNFLHGPATKLHLRLAINDFVMTTDAKKSTRKVHLMYDYDVSKSQVETQHVTLKNLGNATIHYYWKSSEIMQYFKDIIKPKQHNTAFCFNKNEGLVIPGQTRNIPIWFKTNSPGVYVEHWEFYTRPRILPENGKVVIVLHATAAIGNLDEEKEKFKNEIENSIRNRLIKDTLSSVFSNIQYYKTKPTIYAYNKKEVFEAMSGKYDPINLQPKYQYNKEVVRELQQFYKTVRRKTDPKSWNYNIHELRILTNAMQRSNEDVMRRYQCQLSQQISAKQPRMKIPKTVFPTNIFLKDETSLQEEPEEPIQRPIFQSNLNKDLEMIIAKLKSPSIDQNLKVTTYTQVYLIMCRCFYKIENDIERLKHKMDANKRTVYPKLKPCNIHHHYETPLQTFLKPPLIESITNKEHKPADATIRDLPVKDCQTRFNLYFKTVQTKADSSKGKKIQSKPPAKPKSPKPKSPKQKEVKKKEESDDDGYPVDEQFDPYANIVMVPHKHLKSESETVIEEILDEVTFPPPAVLCQFNFNLYVIIYVYLTEAVESIADLLELRSFKETPYPVIKEIEQPSHTRRLIDLKSLIIQENLDNLKAKVILYNYRKASRLNWEKMEMERQLKSTNSDSSLWTILQSYEGKVEKYNDKPVSYPVDIYEGDIQQLEEEVQHVTEATSTSDAKIDRLLSDFQNVSTQKAYNRKDEVDDLEAYIEKIKSETSVHSLYDFKFSKETQKDIDDHVSDQEHFYHSPPNSELSEFSIDSEQSDEDTCTKANPCCNCEN